MNGPVTDPPPECDPLPLPAGMALGWPAPEPTREMEEDLWLRWPVGETLAVRVLSAQPLCYKGHWYPAAGTYRLCTAPRCPLCPLPLPQQAGGRPLASPARQRFILTVELAGGAQRIWEFSESVARQLQGITGYKRVPCGSITRTRELAGLRLVISRVPPRSNGAVIAALDEAPDDRGDMPALIDAAGHVAEAWRRAAIKDGKAPPPAPFG